MDDIAVNKAATIERCISRIREEYAGNAAHLANLTKQDSIVLNIQRACEACIDLAMHRIRTNRLGIPQDSRNAFDLLVSGGRLGPELAERLKRMVGFRNIAIHDYQALNLTIVRAIVEHHLEDLKEFAKVQ